MGMTRLVRATFIAFAFVLISSTLPSAHAENRKPLTAASLNTLLPWITSVSIDKPSSDKLLDAIARSAARATGRKPSETLAPQSSTFDRKVAWLATFLKSVAPDTEKRSLLLRQALQAALAGLHDDGTGLFPPHKYMLPPEKEGYDKGGVGLLVDPTVDARGKFVIFETLDGFPGAEVGLKSGDRLISVDGRTLTGLSYREAADLVRGSLGTRVKLEVERPGAASPQTFDVERVWLNPNPKNISFKVLPGDIGYVRVKYLGERLDVELGRILETFKQKGVKKVVLDLRNNEGLLVGTQDVGGFFLGKGVEITKLVTRHGTEVQRTHGDKSAEAPVTVLVNRYTSGAGVLLASVLQGRGGARLVGESTVWRDQPTESKELTDGSTITVTTGYYVIGKGQKLRSTGDSLKLDVTVPQDPLKPLGGDDDAQLQKAVELSR